MKKLLLFAMILMFAGSTCLCAPLKGDKNNSIGLDSPFLGWLDHDQSGHITSDLGVNLGFGLSYRRYFAPLESNQFNNYWAAGTVAVIIPYLGIGTDYVWDSGLYLGVGLIWIIPEIHGGFMF